MTSDPGHDRFTAAWQAFEEYDARLQAPAHLEVAVMVALHTPLRRRTTRTTIAMALAASMAAVAGLWMVTDRLPEPGPTPLQAQAFSLISLATPVARVAPPSPSSPPSPPSPPSPSSPPSPPSPPSPSSEVLMIFEPMPATPAETLQLVRLRVPSEALLALGLAPLEPDASGLVDIDMLVGDDGLPKNIRRVRVLQEER